ncbi:uncharacterized protein EI90DRAFT_1296527 [Cantharellus anzutake]|uniref:uncharacterized protein n=1 Tax=Cantharellus anzutake TaxID=1750568 RepID=UPI0019050AA2|nr:uncharacterized protein EI90DRAFT_1296527 [Cantharellus anzutake]KAF8342020.1 hypothetical protein EI90DRAFT_1296527 [Cantharellus anzutake]
MGNIGDDSWSGYIHSAALASSGNDDDHTFSVLRGTPLPSANNLHSTLSAAKAISELAGVALSHSEVFEELDMMIGLPWVTACQVLSREIQTQSEKSMGSIQSTFLPQPQAFGQHTPSFAQDASFHTTTAFQPHPHIELLHQQQYQGSVPLPQPPQPSSSSSSFVSSPPLPTVDQNSPGYPISPESLSYTQHSYSTSLLEQNAFSGLKTSGPAYREAEVEKVNATLNALKEQKDVLLRALDRLGNTYEIVRMMRSAM